MVRKPKALVLDTWSLIAYFEDEPAAEQVANIIGDAHENSTPLLMSVVNAGEVWYLFARKSSEADADQIISELRQLGIEFVGIDWALARQAATFKSKHRMSYADCFAAALAREQRAELVTGDREFKQVEGELRIRWLRSEG
jgi:predicted nucleic acid-binding protein